MHTASIKSPVFQRWATAVLISGIAALLFSTNISLFGYSYKAGDIAVIDVMADHDITLEGTDIKKGEIVVRGGDRLTEDAVKKLKAVQDASYGKGFLISTVGVFLFSIILFYTAYTFSARNIRKFASSPKDILLMGVILITILTLVRL